MDILIEDGKNSFDVEVEPVLLQDKNKCELCSSVGEGIRETIDFDGGVMITNSETGHNATADFEVGDRELVQIEEYFYAQSREEFIAVMRRFEKLDEAGAQKIRDEKTSLFCCNQCWTEYMDLTMTLLNQEKVN